MQEQDRPKQGASYINMQDVSTVMLQISNVNSAVSSIHEEADGVKIYEDPALLQRQTEGKPQQIDSISLIKTQLTNTKQPNFIGGRDRTDAAPSGADVRIDDQEQSRVDSQTTDRPLESQDIRLIMMRERAEKTAFNSMTAEQVHQTKKMMERVRLDDYMTWFQ